MARRESCTENIKSCEAKETQKDDMMMMLRTPLNPIALDFIIPSPEKGKNANMNSNRGVAM